jgi:hypothetical protein
VRTGPGGSCSRSAPCRKGEGSRERLEAGSSFRQSDPVPLWLCRAIWASPTPPTTSQIVGSLPLLHLREQPEHDRPCRGFGELLVDLEEDKAGLRVPPELADSLGAV